MKKIIFTLLLNLISLSVFAGDIWDSYYLGGSLGYVDGRARNNEIDIYNGPGYDVGKYSANGMQYGVYGGKN